ncbi:MAG: FtsW/RodA/SpoVE family cell cycle protein [Chloroflexota bacterium]|nr:FtsW/RodA/SpoVE family cell cycle protein [Chloroflexota bacterium]
MRSTPVSIWRQFDWWLLGLTIGLSLFGVLMIRSATLGAIDPDLINRVPSQILYGAISLVVMFVLAALDYRLLGGIWQWLYILMVALLAAVLAFGTTGDGGITQGWLNLGIPVQPAEIAKVLIIVTLGAFLARNYEQMDKFSTVVKSLIHIGIPAALIVAQPDLGMTIVFGFMWFVMVWAAGLRIKQIAIAILVVLLAAPVAIPVVWSRMEAYQQSRFVSFLFEDSDPDAAYNIRQARISIGSGGLFGEGYAQGSQNTGRFLRVRHTDFIFSVISEEFGFVGAMTTMILLGIVIARVLRGARQAIDPLGSLICYGVAAFLFFQTFVSIGMNLGLMPVTGLTLPFISSGGTSLLSTLAGIGLAQSVIMRRGRVL